MDNQVLRMLLYILQACRKRRRQNRVPIRALHRCHRYREWRQRVKRLIHRDLGIFPFPVMNVLLLASARRPSFGCRIEESAKAYVFLKHRFQAPKLEPIPLVGKERSGANASTGPGTSTSTSAVEKKGHPLACCVLSHDILQALESGVFTSLFLKKTFEKRVAIFLFLTKLWAEPQLEGLQGYLA